MNIRQQIPWVVRKPNRPEPLAVMPRRKHWPEVFAHDDGTYSLAYMTRAQAELVREALSHDVRNYGPHYDLSVMLGYEPECEDHLYA